MTITSYTRRWKQDDGSWRQETVQYDPGVKIKPQHVAGFRKWVRMCEQTLLKKKVEIYLQTVEN
jgi:hypothetical protein